MLLCFGGCFTLALLLFKAHSAFTPLTMANIAALALMFGISQGLLGVYIPLLFPVPIRATATGMCFNFGRYFTAAAVYFVGAEEGATSLVKGMYVHEFVHDGRHLLGFPCH